MRAFAICIECGEPHLAGRPCPGCQPGSDSPPPGRATPATPPAAPAPVMGSAPARLARVLVLGVVGLGLTACSLLALSYLTAS